MSCSKAEINRNYGNFKSGATTLVSIHPFLAYPASRLNSRRRKCHPWYRRRARGQNWLLERGPDSAPVSTQKRASPQKDLMSTSDNASDRGTKTGRPNKGARNNGNRKGPNNNQPDNTLGQPKPLRNTDLGRNTRAQEQEQERVLESRTTNRPSLAPGTPGSPRRLILGLEAIFSYRGHQSRRISGDIGYAYQRIFAESTLGKQAGTPVPSHFRAVDDVLTGWQHFANA
jgi:hypothetical protein